jgi:LysM repeat protein
VPDPPIAREKVTVHKPVDLARVAELTGSTLADLQLLNSALRTRSTPQGVPAYDLWVPAGTASLLAPRLAALPAAPAVSEKRIVVKKGDTLQKIAKRAGVSVAELCDWNDLTRTARPRTGTVLVVPGKRGPRGEAQASTSEAGRGEIRGVPTPAAAVTRASQVGPFTSSVPPTTASRSRESAAAVVPIPAEGFADAPAKKAAPAAPPTRLVRHVVKPGDTLFAIASRYGLSVDEIRRQNHIRSPQSLKAGQTLVLSLATLN